MSDLPQSLDIVVFGASGDLARKKIYPALFSLFCRDLLPANTRIAGFARSDHTAESFRDSIAQNLTRRYMPDHSCAERTRTFLERCDYMAGAYDDPSSLAGLLGMLARSGTGQQAARMFYFAVPPFVLPSMARTMGTWAVTGSAGRPLWTRVIVEKPFGRDRESSDALNSALSSVFTEEQIYRIDHYLGKEVIQNMLVLRFANLVFEPIWNRNFIRSVSISWSEDIGVEGRGSYFDSYGIIRDVVQNHLMQIVALVAMEPPSILAAGPIRDEKVKLLEAIPAVKPEDMVTGQYSESSTHSRPHPAYRGEKNVPAGSITPTFAAAALRINNRRWDGVPFLLRAGKGLDRRMTEVRIRFQPVPGNMFCQQGGCPDENELAIRIQPDEAINLSIVSKVPGLDMALASRPLDLQYRTTFQEKIPDAYERLLLDVMQGDKGLFIRDDELAAAWDIFTPVLHAYENDGKTPEAYPFGSVGPDISRLTAGNRFT